MGVVDILSVPPQKRPLYKPGFTIQEMSASMDTEDEIVLTEEEMMNLYGLYSLDEIDRID